MKSSSITLLIATLLASPASWAINATYAKQLERSGCTQLSEGQGCDIKKSKEENARAGFGSATPAASPSASSPTAASSAAASPYTGKWVAKSDGGATVATISIDAKERVIVNGKKVRAKRSDGGLAFRLGKISFRIQGDRRLKGQDTWTDSDAGTKGLIFPG